MWQKLKPKKPSITIKVILKANVATMIETHFEVDITTMKVNNQMAIIQVQVGKNPIEDILLNGGASVNIIIKNLRIKVDQTKTNPIPLQNGISNNDYTFRNHQKFEDSHTWHTICSHIYYFAKQCGRF
jgi:hypothetical protein